MQQPEPISCFKRSFWCVAIGLLVWLGFAALGFAQPGADAERESGGPPPFGQGGLPPGGPGFGGPGGRGPGGPGFGGIGGEDMEILEQFDEDFSGYLDAEERKAAREHLKQERGDNSGQRRGGRFPGRGGNESPPQPGMKLSPADVESFPDAPLYDPLTLRTLFLEFESEDWEQELSDFHGTDVDVPARLTVDGETYEGVGIRFRGMSSYMMVSAGRKRSLNLSMNYVHKGQRLGEYRTLNLLNSHGDASFLRANLALEIARDYMPAPRASFVRVVINGENWGVYPSVQQFNKDFIQEQFGTKKGARWKVQGSPMGRGGLNYLGDDPEPYRQIFTLKTKENPKSWAALITLCKVLDTTPASQLEHALESVLDVDGALRFLAWENVLVNNDGYWTRASDYNLYQDVHGRFHIIPHDANETFSMGGGMFGPRGPGGPGGFEGAGGFGSGMFIAPQFVLQGDRDDDQKLSAEEFNALAALWFEKLDAEGRGKLSSEQFTAEIGDVFGMPEGPDGFGPAMFLGPGLFTTVDVNENGSLTQAELEDSFARWLKEWDVDQTGRIDEAAIRDGLDAVLPQPEFAQPGRGVAGPGGRGGRDGSRRREAGGPGGRRGRGGPGGGMMHGSVDLDPLVAVDDAQKPLLSKLLAVPSLRTRYLGYVHEMTEHWLDWNTLGPVVRQYKELIEEDVKLDTRKLESYEAFVEQVSDPEEKSESDEAGGHGSLKNFAKQRRDYLLNRPEVKSAANR